MKELALRFVCWFVRNHMSHEHPMARKAIFRAIWRGTAEAFYEDNAYALRYWLRDQIEEAGGRNEQ